jgi:malate synthase
LPIAREIVATYVRHKTKAPWYIDLLNLNLGNHDLGEARRRNRAYLHALDTECRRITGNQDWSAPEIGA